MSWYHYKTKSKASAAKPSFDAFNADRRRAWVENWDLYAADNKTIIDFVGRYENLDDDFASVLARIGLSGQVSLPKANVSKDRGTYRDYYTPASRDLIAGWYAREIEQFAYQF